MRGKEPRASRRYEGFFEIVFPASAKYPAQASVLGTVKLEVIVAADVVGDKSSSGAWEAGKWSSLYLYEF